MATEANMSHPPPRPSQVMKVLTQQLTSQQLKTPTPPSILHPRAISFLATWKKNTEEIIVFLESGQDYFIFQGFILESSPKKLRLYDLGLYLVLFRQSIKLLWSKKFSNNWYIWFNHPETLDY